MSDGPPQGVREGRALTPVRHVPWRHAAAPGVRDVLTAGVRLRRGRLDRDAARWVSRVEGLRRHLAAADTPIPNRRAEPRTVAGVLEAAAMPQRHCLVLFELLRARAPRSGIELGASLGLSSCYQGAALATAARGRAPGRLVAIEGSEGLAEVARANHRRLGLGHVDVVTGRFESVLPDVLGDLTERDGPLGWAFVDGHHQEDPTVAYFDTLAEAAENGAVLVFDDIMWSEGMRRAWATITADPRVRWATRTDRLGVAVLR